MKQCNLLLFITLISIIHCAYHYYHLSGISDCISSFTMDVSDGTITCFDNSTEIVSTNEIVFSTKIENITDFGNVYTIGFWWAWIKHSNIDHEFTIDVGPWKFIYSYDVDKYESYKEIHHYVKILYKSSYYIYNVREEYQMVYHLVLYHHQWLPHAWNNILFCVSNNGKTVSIYNNGLIIMKLSKSIIFSFDNNDQIAIRLSGGTSTLRVSNLFVTNKTINTLERAYFLESPENMLTEMEHSTTDCDVNIKIQCNTTTLLHHCFNVLQNDNKVCSSHGKCISKDECQCNEHYDGENCESYECFGKNKERQDVCSGHGSCIDYNICICDNENELYHGVQCKNRLYICNTAPGYDLTPRNWWEKILCISPDEYYNDDNE